MEEIIFRRPALEDQELIRSYFDKAPSRSCERTFCRCVFCGLATMM